MVRVINSIDDFVGVSNIITGSLYIKLIMSKYYDKCNYHIHVSIREGHKVTLIIDCKIHSVKIF